MRFLLDTHTLVWAAFTPERLSAAARAIIEDGDVSVFVSAISAFEIATKVRLGKFEMARPLATGFSAKIEAQGFMLLSLTAEHAELAGSLLLEHKDPWDRVLLAQSQIENLTLVTNDETIRRFGLSTLW